MNTTSTPYEPSAVVPAGVGPSAKPAGRTSLLLRGILVASAAVLTFSACSDDSADAPTDSVVGEATAAVQIDPAEGQAMMASLGQELTVIDVRTPEEYAAGHVEGAVNIDVEGGGFSAAIASLDTSAPYIVYCQSGRRSAIAADAMVAAGFTDVNDMGGIQDWTAAGLPVVTG
jgi:phage shock protein E